MCSCLARCFSIILNVQPRQMGGQWYFFKLSKCLSSGTYGLQKTPLTMIVKNNWDPLHGKHSRAETFCTSLKKNVMQSPETDDNVLSFFYEEITSDNRWYNNTDFIPLLWLLLILHHEYERVLCLHECITMFSDRICDKICNPCPEITSPPLSLFYYFWQFLEKIN